MRIASLDGANMTNAAISSRRSIRSKRGANMNTTVVGDIIVFRDALGNETKFEWTTRRQNKILITRLARRQNVYSYNERDFLSEIADEFRHGLENHVYNMTMPDASGGSPKSNSRKSKWSASGVIEYDDQNNLDFRNRCARQSNALYRYAGYDKLAERTDALGYNRKFQYDREERSNK